MVVKYILRYSVGLDEKSTTNVYYMSHRSMVELAKTELATEDVENLLDNLLNAAGLQGVDCLDFEHFKSLLSPYMGALNNMSLHWKGETCRGVPNGIFE